MFESDCLCARDGPKKRQSCLQCIVDLGPRKTFGYASVDALEAEWGGSYTICLRLSVLDEMSNIFLEPVNDWCTELGFYSANVTAYIPPTPGSPAVQGNGGMVYYTPRYLVATAVLLATLAVLVGS